MAERDQVRGALGRLDPGDPGRPEHVALGHGVAGHLGRRLRQHEHLAPGDGPPMGGLLGGDVDHAGSTQRVEVRQTTIGHGPSRRGRPRSCPAAGRQPTTSASGPPAADLAHGPLGWMKWTWPIECPAHLRPTSAAMAAARSSSVPPPRRMARRSVSSDGEQAVAELALGGEADPVAGGAERRVTLAMTPTSPPPSRYRNRSAGWLPRSVGRHQRVDGVDGGHDLGGGHHPVVVPTRRTRRAA